MTCFEKQKSQRRLFIEDIVICTLLMAVVVYLMFQYDDEQWTPQDTKEAIVYSCIDGTMHKWENNVWVEVKVGHAALTSMCRGSEFNMPMEK